MRRHLLVVICITLMGYSSAIAGQISSADSSIIFRKVDSLTGGSKSDFDKVKVIFSWITQNIQYDYEMYGKYLSRSNEYHSKSIFATFDSKKGICNDFAQLFKSMVSHAGIKCEVITGYGRYEDDDFFAELYFLKHAWNAVLINKSWLLLDVTWASIFNRSAGYTGYHFFLQSPDKFIYTHFPDDVKWTFLRKQITYEEFIRQPMIKAKYFEFLTVYPPKEGVISTESETVLLGTYFCHLVDSLGAFAELINVKDNEVADVDLDCTTTAHDKKAFRVRIPFKGKFYLRFSISVKSGNEIDNELEFITFLIERT
jgi:hypothetical protein